MMKNLALYIHIPFCKTRKCKYCNFVSFCNRDDKKNEYVDALCKEIKMRGEKLGKSYKVSSIFIGGGTPSTLELGQISKIMLCIKRYFIVLPYAEITIEGNPESLTKEKMKEYLLVGVNRLSIGGQSLRDDILQVIGRQHSSRDLKDAIKLAKESGFQNINVDMMLGLPNQKVKDVVKMAKYLIKQGVSHVSAYSLILEENTPLYEMVQKGSVTLPSEDETVEMYNAVRSELESNQLSRYEVSNFALPDYESRHNQNYWKSGEYLAFGVAGHSYLNYFRFSNTEDLDKYLNTLFADILPVEKMEKISHRERKEEMIMLSLRMKEGLDLREYERNFGENLLKEKEKEVEFLVSHGLIKVKRDHLCVADNAFYVLNTIIEKLV